MIEVGWVPNNRVISLPVDATVTVNSVASRVCVARAKGCVIAHAKPTLIRPFALSHDVFGISVVKGA